MQLCRSTPQRRSGRRARPAGRAGCRSASSGTLRATPSGSASSGRRRPAADAPARAARMVSPTAFRALAHDDLAARPDSRAAGISGRSSGVILSHHVIPISGPSRRCCGRSGARARHDRPRSRRIRASAATPNRGRSRRARRRRAETAEPHKPMSLVDIAELPRVLDPQLSPNGRFVIYMLSHADWNAGRWVYHLWRQDTRGGPPVQLTSGGNGEASRHLALGARRRLAPLHPRRPDPAAALGRRRRAARVDPPRHRRVGARLVAGRRRSNISSPPMREPPTSATAIAGKTTCTRWTKTTSRVICGAWPLRRGPKSS